MAKKPPPAEAAGRPQAGASGDGAPPLRADARRNRARVLEAAQAVFATEGLSVPIDEIARRAGVGAGTVYRHFPTKEALFEAIVLGSLRRLVDEARSLATAADPGAAFFGLLSRMLAEGRANKALKDALAGAGFDVAVAAPGVVQDLRRAVDELLTRARHGGAVRDDIGVADLMALVAGAFVAMDHHGGDAGLPDRVLAVVYDGLRPAGSRLRGDPLLRPLYGAAADDNTEDTDSQDQPDRGVEIEGGDDDESVEEDDQGEPHVVDVRALPARAAATQFGEGVPAAPPRVQGEQGQGPVDDTPGQG